MNVDAMIKHHQAVTEVITHAMSDYASAATGTSWNNACFAFEADAILCALSRAGFRILGPDEVDPVTVERCVEVAAATDPEKPANWLHRREEIAAAIRTLSSPDHADADTLETYYARQIEWSKNTFGPALRTKGIIDHIKKELKEIEAEPHDLSEWIDVVILAMDGFWRHGGTVDDLMPRLLAKQKKNMARTWPNWRTMSEDQAIEHDRSFDADHADAGKVEGDGVERKFQLGDRVTKNKGSSWTGRVVGFYSTELTPTGYAVESETEIGSVQIYPEAALCLAPSAPASEGAE